MPNEQQLSFALKRVGSRYHDLAKRDISLALQQFQDLEWKEDSYYFEDGKQRKVVALTGTIPVTYRSNVYNIPVSLYLLETHPYHPPFVYVRPTAEMMIKQSRHVDDSGRVYLPYLSEWRHPTSDLNGLLQIVTMTFSEHMPVFSRAAAAAAAAAAATPVQPPYPAYPSANPAMPMPTGFNSQATGDVNPPYPAPNNYSSGTGGSINAAHLRASLVSAVEDKLRRKSRDVIGGLCAEVQSIRNTGEELRRGETRLNDMMNKLESEQSALNTAIERYNTRSQEADRVLETTKRSDSLDIDDSIDTTSPLYRQLFSCYADDAAIDDTVYCLGEALRNQQINLEHYLKSVRNLARKQYKLRATMLKCREKALL